MTFLRHSARVVQKTIEDHLTAQLATLSWTTAGTPFGLEPVVVQRHTPQDYETWKALSPGRLAISFGEEESPLDEELGGPLHSHTLAVFVDVYMATDAHALALASDVRDALLGRLPGSQRVLTMLDPVSSVPVDGWSLEIESVTMGRMEGELNWYVVTAVYRVYFPESRY